MFTKEQVISIGHKIAGDKREWKAEQHSILLLCIVGGLCRQHKIEALPMLNDLKALLEIKGLGLCNASQMMDTLGFKDKAKEKPEEKAGPSALDIMQKHGIM